MHPGGSVGGFVVHGSVLSLLAGKRIDHAWCERGEVIVDLAMPDGMKILTREQYYRVLQPKVSKRYTSGDASVLSIRNRHYGPWDESEQLPERQNSECLQSMDGT